MAGSRGFPVVAAARFAVAILAGSLAEDSFGDDAAALLAELPNLLGLASAVGRLSDAAVRVESFRRGGDAAMPEPGGLPGWCASTASMADDGYVRPELGLLDAVDAVGDVALAWPETQQGGRSKEGRWAAPARQVFEEAQRANEQVDRSLRASNGPETRARLKMDRHLWSTYPYFQAPCRDGSRRPLSRNRHESQHESRNRRGARRGGRIWRKVRPEDGRARRRRIDDSWGQIRLGAREQEGGKDDGVEVTAGGWTESLWEEVVVAAAVRWLAGWMSGWTGSSAARVAGSACWGGRPTDG